MSLPSKGLSGVFSSTIIWKHWFLGAQPSYGPALTSRAATEPPVKPEINYGTRHTPNSNHSHVGDSSQGKRGAPRRAGIFRVDSLGGMCVTWELSGWYLSTKVWSMYHQSSIVIFKKWLRDFPGGPVVKNPPWKAGDAGSIPGWELRSHMPRSNWRSIWCKEEVKCMSESPRGLVKL